MELDDIRRVQADWAAAARRAREAGFDIVYVYGAHSYLPMQFLSPFYNRRTDEYGGSLENRARFWLELLELMREAVDGECTVATRISVAALSPYGRRRSRKGSSSCASPTTSSTSGTSPSARRPSGRRTRAPRGSSSRAGSSSGRSTCARRPRKPIVGVSRLTDPDQMAEIVSSGVWDVIGAARPSIADPFLPRKIEEGRLDEIRECIGCNICIPKSDPGGNIGCTQNATAGEEFRRGWHPGAVRARGERDHDVLVVGAGPAGMECAIVLGKRGFRRVHLVEAGDDIGGIMRWIPQLPGPRASGPACSTGAASSSASCGTSRCSPALRLDADDVREYGAEIVVVATGRALVAGRPERRHPRADRGRRRLAAARASRPSRSWSRARRRPASASSSTTRDGYFMGPDLAERLARRRARASTS